MDPISDMFIRIKNAQKAGHETVQIPYSKFKHEIAKSIERAGLLAKVEKKGKRIKRYLEIVLKYMDEVPLINDVRLISLPSRRIYISYKDFYKTRGSGVIIISTPRGVMSSIEARKEKVGGELIAEIS